MIIVLGIVLLFIGFLVDNILIEKVSVLRNPLLDYFLGWATYAVSVVFVLLVMTSLFMWEEHKRDWIMPIWLSFIAAGIVSVVLKFIVSRERPLGLEMGLFIFKNFSFPSTHAAACFSVVPILDQEYPMFKWFWIGFAALVAFSRLYLQVHYMTDIIAGALIGYVIGITLIYFKKRYRFMEAQA
ncbi:phosphatase PAP2 family protein [Candidatus Woesearchaeota archaeon]|nr:phosphatase PAP2 family protein [Candidatus Woesearchaeota archaeon]